MSIEPWTYDLRLAWRGLRRARGFTTAAVLTLSVGMAGATSIIATIEGVLLRPLPTSNPERLVAVWKQLPATGAAHWPLYAAEVKVIRDASLIFAGVAAAGYNEASPSEVFDETVAGY